MTPPAPTCEHVLACAWHADRLLAHDVGAATDAQPALERLAGQLRELRNASARLELVAAGGLLGMRFETADEPEPDDLCVRAVLERNRGSALVLGAIAVTAARRAGIPLGLLAGPHGDVAVAHATLAKPLVLAIDERFAVRDVRGEESSYRWLCAHATERRVASLRAAAAAPRQRLATIS